MPTKNYIDAQLGDASLIDGGLSPQGLRDMQDSVGIAGGEITHHVIFFDQYRAGDGEWGAFGTWMARFYLKEKSNAVRPGL